MELDDQILSSDNFIFACKECREKFGEPDELERTKKLNEITCATEEHEENNHINTLCN